MSKMHYFSDKFFKIAKRWVFPTPASLNLQYWWPALSSVIWSKSGFWSWLWRNRTSKI